METFIKSPKQSFCSVLLLLLGWSTNPWGGGGEGGQRGWGLTLNPMEKFIHYIVNDYSLKTNEDIDMGSSDAYIEC